VSSVSRVELAPSRSDAVGALDGGGTVLNDQPSGDVHRVPAAVTSPLVTVQDVARGSCPRTKGRTSVRWAVGEAAGGVVDVGPGGDVVGGLRRAVRAARAGIARLRRGPSGAGPERSEWSGVGVGDVRSQRGRCSRAACLAARLDPIEPNSAASGYNSGYGRLSSLGRA
jgi:hypothetical protein